MGVSDPELKRLDGKVSDAAKDRFRAFSEIQPADRRVKKWFLEEGRNWQDCFEVFRADDPKKWGELNSGTYQAIIQAAMEDNMCEAFLGLWAEATGKGTEWREKVAKNIKVGASGASL